MLSLGIFHAASESNSYTLYTFQVRLPARHPVRLQLRQLIDSLGMAVTPAHLHNIDVVALAVSVSESSRP
jgi:hypothetical protein